MKRFTVTLQYAVKMTAIVEVAADTAAEAERAALDDEDAEDIEWTETEQTGAVCTQVEEVAP